MRRRFRLGALMLIVALSLLAVSGCSKGKSDNGASANPTLSGTKWDSMVWDNGSWS
jgi:hypothetical protein